MAEIPQLLDSPGNLPADQQVNILLVDDVPANLLALEVILQDLGHNLVKARSGEETLHLLLSDEFAVILLDVQMPGMDGFETATLIRKQDNASHTPIIFLTGHDQDRFPVEQAYMLGAVDYLVKPLVPVILRAKVAGFVELFQKTEQVKRQAELLRQMERREFEERLALENARLRASEHDITQRKLAEEGLRNAKEELERRVEERTTELARANEALRQADRRKDEFLATLAHELRNPLAPIRSGLQVMRLAGGDRDAVEQARTMIDRQLTHLVRLVDDLMDVSRISRGKIELRREQVLLATVVYSAVETSRPLIEQMGHELTVTLPTQPVVVNADLIRLAQVFSNLLNNAAKYTEHGGHIWFTAEREASDVVVSVKDSGIGIAPDQLPHLFTMFSQLDHALERSQGGLGIGLTLVKRLTELHGARIEVRSEGLGKGSEFIVRLPVVVEEPMWRPSRSEEPATVQSSLRILIVDDNRDGADSLSMMLRMMGNETCTAYDGEEAVTAATEFRPDVILLDLGLPKLTGYEACRRIRQQPDGKEPVIIAQTGWGQEEDRQRTHEAGFDHHMVKPVDPQALMKLLAELQAAKG
jgi:signal transduction histidine kinase